MSITKALRGISGEFEINRIVGCLSGVGYTFGALGFTAWNMFEGRAFDVVSFCTSFGGGAAFITGSTAGAIAIKDKAVAGARVTQETGKVPAAPPAGPVVAEGEVQQAPPTSPPPSEPHSAEILPEYAR